MRLYTYDEIRHDIESFESVKIGESPVPVDNFRFVKLYSECFSDPLHVNLSVDSLKNRINGYFSDHSLKVCDIWPDASHNFFIYDATSAFDQDGCLLLLGTAETKEDSMSLICSDEISNKTTSVCVVATQTSEIIYLNRPLQ